MSAVSQKPFLIGTHNAGPFLHAGIEALNAGGSALDAVEAATRLVELNVEDTSVGVGRIPNLLGVQEMDASIMCGQQVIEVVRLQRNVHGVDVTRREGWAV